MDDGRHVRPEREPEEEYSRRRRSDQTPNTTQIVGALVAVILAGLGIYNQHLTTEIDRLIDTQQAELQRLSVLETTAGYNMNAIGSIDDRIRREVEIAIDARLGGP